MKQISIFIVRYGYGGRKDFNDHDEAYEFLEHLFNNSTYGNLSIEKMTFGDKQRIK